MSDWTAPPRPTYQPPPPPPAPPHAGPPPASPPPRGRGAQRIAAVVLLLVIAFGAGVLIGGGALTAPPTAIGPTPAGPATPAAPTTPPAVPGTPATPGQTPRPGETAPPIVTAPPGVPGTQPADAPADFGLFWQALETVREHFVGRDELEDTQLTYGAIRGLVDALGDTGHSVFLTPEALAAERQALEGRVVGVGALLGERHGRPVIVSVVSGGPASRAGMRSGDMIIAVDDVNVEQMRPDEIASRVRGEAGTTVVVTVFRPATSQTIDFSMVREEITFPAASWAFVPGTQIAVVRLIQFSDGAGEQLRAARDEAVAQGAQGLVLDLRSNPGGFVHEAIRVASLFLDQRTVYIRELASGERIPVATDPAYRATDLPLVVLIDQGTASSSEIVSGAIRSAGRAELVGETTFGTGTVLLTFELADGSAIRIAVERWLTPDGDLIFGQGIEPTIEVVLPPDAIPLDPQELAQLDPAAVPNMPDDQLLRAIDVLRAAGVP